MKESIGYSVRSVWIGLNYRDLIGDLLAAALELVAGLIGLEILVVLFVVLVTSFQAQRLKGRREQIQESITVRGFGSVDITAAVAVATVRMTAVFAVGAAAVSAADGD